MYVHTVIIDMKAKTCTGMFRRTVRELPLLYRTTWYHLLSRRQRVLLYTFQVVWQENSKIRFCAPKYRIVYNFAARPTVIRRQHNF